MKLYYLSTDEHNRALAADWHGLDLGNGKVLTCVRFRDELHEMEWSNHPDVIRLPHPIFQSTAPIPDEHLQHLSGRYSELKNGHTVHDLIQHASKEDPWMRLHVL